MGAPASAIISRSAMYRSFSKQLGCPPKIGPVEMGVSG
jgi:hypothetical protein